MKNILSAASQIAVAMGLVATLPSAIQADQVFNDDVIITFSLCVGNDCVNGESFGFDTVRLKENNLRIHFEDTSTSASFPTNDWRITINDSSNGGGNYFAIDDVSGSRTPFRVDAGAPTNAVRVDSAGDLGLGTANPVVDLHVVSGNTPTLRLEQDGSSGFTAQTFDIASNEANFFVRDVTNGSQLVFRIEPGADQDALYIEDTNHIGLGTNNPLGRLHIKGSGTERQMILLEQTTAATNWVIANYETTAIEGAGNFGINLVGGGNMFKIDQSGGVYLPTVPNCSNGLQTGADGIISCIP
jgi:predicted aspartyl protease